MDARAVMELCVLGSGSRGNCGVLRVLDPDEPGNRRADRLILIDLGFSPRRTQRMLEAVGYCMEQVSAAVLTHLDRDHCHAGWCSREALPQGVRVLVHRAHQRRAEREGLAGGVITAWDEREHVAGRVEVTACVSAHDALGVATLRFSVGAASLGYATDLGCVTEDIVEHLHRVSVLAIESNYCPALQAQSTRPEFLKRRITGGAGHLSNAESARAVSLIRPLGAVVLLHLSSECNRPELALEAHDAWRRPVTVSLQECATEFVPVESGVEVLVGRQMGLWKK